VYVIDGALKRPPAGNCQRHVRSNTVAGQQKATHGLQHALQQGMALERRRRRRRRRNHSDVTTGERR